MDDVANIFKMDSVPPDAPREVHAEFVIGLPLLT